MPRMLNHENVENAGTNLAGSRQTAEELIIHELNNHVADRLRQRADAKLAKANNDLVGMARAQVEDVRLDDQRATLEPAARWLENRRGVEVLQVKRFREER